MVVVGLPMIRGLADYRAWLEEGIRTEREFFANAALTLAWPL
jgi:hypothetical protein